VLRSRVEEWFVNFTCAPEPMQEHGEFAGDGDDCALLRVRSPTRGDGEALAAEVAVRREWAENVLRRSNEQPPKVRIAFLGDVPLRLTFARVVLSWDQAKPCSDAAAPFGNGPRLRA
jgi:hypothetical protein